MASTETPTSRAARVEARIHKMLQNAEDATKLTGVAAGFGRTTSVHGIPHVFDTTYRPLRRACWLVLFLGSIVGLCIILGALTREYRDYASTNSVSVVPRRNSEAPAITICNNNDVSLANIDPITTPHFVPVLEGRSPYYGATQAEYEEVGYAVNGLILSCTIAGVACPLEMFQHTLDPYYGNCVTINKGGPFTFKDVTYNNAPDGRRLRINSTGSFLGYSLVLNAQQDTYPPYDSNSTYDTAQTPGMRITIHDSTVLPDTDETALLLGPGQNYEIGIRRTVTQRLNGPWGNCPDDWYPSNDPFGYDRSRCIVDCLGGALLEVCGCVPGGFETGQHPTTPFCSLRGSQNSSTEACVNEVYDQFADQKFTCDCPVRCNEATYTINHISSAPWPGKNAIPGIASELNTTEESVTENGLFLTVYFVDFNEATNTQTKSMSLATYLSSLGGNSGLMAGISLLSIGEILEFGFLSLLLCWTRYRHKDTGKGQIMMTVKSDRSSNDPPTF